MSCWMCCEWAHLIFSISLPSTISMKSISGLKVEFVLIVKISTTANFSAPDCITSLLSLLLFTITSMSLSIALEDIDIGEIVSENSTATTSAKIFSNSTKSSIILIQRDRSRNLLISLSSAQSTNRVRLQRNISFSNAKILSEKS